MKYVVITGTARNIGLELCREFLKRGWHVFAGRYESEAPLLDELQAEYEGMLDVFQNDVTNETSMEEAVRFVSSKTDTVDMIVHNAAAFGRSHENILTDRLDLSAYMQCYNTNALGAMRLTKYFLPLMKNGMKRLCFVSSEAGAVSVAHREALSGYCMSKTALNMALRLMFNQLQPQGYTFRLYHPGWVRSTHDGKPDPNHPGKFEPWETAQKAVPYFLSERKWEDRLILIDNEGAAWPF